MSVGSPSTNAPSPPKKKSVKWSATLTHVKEYELFEGEREGKRPGGSFMDLGAREHEMEKEGAIRLRQPKPSLPVWPRLRQIEMDDPARQFTPGAESTERERLRLYHENTAITIPSRDDPVEGPNVFTTVKTLTRRIPLHELINTEPVYDPAAPYPEQAASSQAYSAPYYGDPASYQSYAQASGTSYEKPYMPGTLIDTQSSDLKDLLAIINSSSTGNSSDQTSTYPYTSSVPSSSTSSFTDPSSDPTSAAASSSLYLDNASSTHAYQSAYDSSSRSGAAQRPAYDERAPDWGSERNFERGYDRFQDRSHYRERSPPRRSSPTPSSRAPSTYAAGTGRPSYAGMNSSRMCHFYNTPQGCRRGEHCQFIHR